MVLAITLSASKGRRALVGGVRQAQAVEAPFLVLHIFVSSGLVITQEYRAFEELVVLPTKRASRRLRFRM